MIFCSHCNWVMGEYEKEYRYNNAYFCESCYYLLWVEDEYN